MYTTLKDFYLDCESIKILYRLIDLSRQKELDADAKATKQIEAFGQQIA